MTIVRAIEVPDRDRNHCEDAVKLAEKIQSEIQRIENDENVHFKSLVLAGKGMMPPVGWGESPSKIFLAVFSN